MTAMALGPTIGHRMLKNKLLVNTDQAHH